MRLFNLCTSSGVRISLNEAARYSALATHLQSSMRLATIYRSSTSSWKLESVGAGGAEGDWSVMMDSESKKVVSFSAPTLPNVETEPCG